MTESHLLTIPSTHMLSIFSGVDIEQPYRFQPFIRFDISFNEYVKFVKTMVGLSISWLSYDKSLYEKALKLNDTNLLVRLFYFDVSKSIISEITLANINKEDGTIISHSFDDSDEIESIDIYSVPNELVKFSKEKLEKSVNSFKREMSVNVLDTSSLSEHNLLLFRYALFLRTLSYERTANKINIVF